MPYEQILEFVDNWAAAERQGDAPALDRLMADDCTLIGPRGFVLNRHQSLDRYSSGALRTEAFEWSDLTVRSYERTAVVVGIVAQRAAYQGHDASGRFRATQIVVEQDGQWKCAGLQFSGPIPELPPRAGDNAHPQR
jgi:ketosteroid isomerase-like protein